MVRRIFVNDISEIDYANFGVHFSENNGYRHSKGGSNGSTEKKRFEVRAIVESAKINASATEISRSEYPTEEELVLEFGQQLDAKIIIVDTKTGYYVGSHNGEIKSINTGNRCDTWVVTLK